jgi:hypothetical protein
MTPQEIVEATLYTLRSAIYTDISTADWKNRLMAEIVEEVRVLKKENEKLKALQSHGLPRIEGENS